MNILETKIRENIDYDYFQSTKKVWTDTTKTLPYSINVNWCISDIYISKNDYVSRWGYIKISTNNIKYQDIKESIQMKYGSFDPFGFEYYFTPATKDHFYEIIVDILTQLAELYEVTESLVIDSEFVVPDPYGLNSNNWWGSLTVVNLILKSKNTDTSLDNLILDNSVRKKIWIMLLCIENKLELEENGWKVPKWYIFKWKPWLWKTSIMKSLAKELNDNIVIFNLSRKDYTSKYIGDGEKSFAEILDWIQDYGLVNNKHCIIFFDEFDDIWKIRANTHEAHAAELNVLLRFLDWLWNSDNVTFIAWTNSDINELDPAILRGWRTDDIIELTMPDTWMIEKYLNKRILDLIYKWIFSENILSQNIYSNLENLSFWDINTILNELLNTRFINMKFGEIYSINQEMVLEKISEYKKNKWITRNFIGFNIHS